VLKATVAAGVALVFAVPAFAGYGGGPDVTVLIRQATKLVRAKSGFSKAVLLEADGTTTNGKKVTVESGITKWRFVFNNQTTPGFKFRSAYVNRTSGHFGTVVAVKQPFVEDRNIVTPPTMTLTRAIAKLRAAGYTSGFSNVTLRWPLNPGNKETLYIFGFGSSAKHPNVSVGTKTGKVKPIS
jgi:hypothetical protein